MHELRLVLAIFAAFALATMSFLAPTANAQAQNSVSISSSQLFQGLDISLNQSSNQIQYTTGTKQSITTFSGHTGDTIDVKLVTENSDGSTTQQTISANLGTAIYKWTTSIIGYIPKHGALVHLKSYSQFSNTQKEAVRGVGNLLSEEIPVPQSLINSGGSRKRSSTDHEPIFVTPLERAQMKMQEKNYERERKGGGGGGASGKKDKSDLRKKLEGWGAKAASNTHRDEERKVEVTVTGILAKTLIMAKVLREGTDFIRPDGKTKEESIIDINMSADQTEERINNRLLKIKMGLKDDDYLMPDSHYLYPVKDTWVRSTDLSAADRLQLRLSGKASAIMEEMKKDPLAVAVAAFKLKTLNNDIERANLLVEEMNSLMQGSLTGNYTYQDPRETSSFGYSEEEEEEGNNNNNNNNTHHSRRKRYDSNGQPSVFDQVSDPTKYPEIAALIAAGGASCAGMNVIDSLANVAACTLQSLATLTSNVNAQFANIQAEFGVQQTINAQFLAAGQNLQTQDDNLQQELNLSQQQTQNLANAVNDLTVAANTQIQTNNLLNLSTQKLAYTQNLLQGTTTHNSIQIVEALDGQSELVNEQLVSFQDQVQSQFGLMQAEVENNIKTIYISMATSQAQLVTQLNSLATDTGSRLQALVNSVNNQFATISEVVAKDHQAVARLNTFVATLYSAITDIFQQEFYRGTLPVDYWMYKRYVALLNNGTMMPLVIEGTGNPPANLTQYTTIDGRSVSFSLTSQGLCAPTTAQINTIKAAQTASVMANTIMVADVPIGVHPDVVAYTSQTANVTTVPIESLKLYHMSFGLSAGNNVLLYYSGSAISTILDTPANRLNSGVLRFYFTTDSPQSLTTLAILDGDLTHVYATVGSFFFKVNFAQSVINSTTNVPSFDLSVTQIPAMGNIVSTPVQTRLFSTLLSTMKQTVAGGYPLYQGNPVVLIPLISPQVPIAANGLPPISLDPTTLAVIGMGAVGLRNGTYATTVAFYKANPMINTTTTTDTLENTLQQNATLSQLAGGYSDPALSRSRRAYPDSVTLTMSQVYTGITINSQPATYPGNSYSTLSPSSQIKAQQCLAKGGSYVSIKEPLTTQIYSGYSMSGTRQDIRPAAGATSTNIPGNGMTCYYGDSNPAPAAPVAQVTCPSGGPCVDFGLGNSYSFHSAIIPPSINGLWANNVWNNVNYFSENYSGKCDFFGLTGTWGSYDYKGSTSKGGSDSVVNPLGCMPPPFNSLLFGATSAPRFTNIGASTGLNGIVGQSSTSNGLTACSAPLGLPIWLYYPASSSNGVSNNNWEACLPYDASTVNIGVSTPYMSYSLPYFFSANDISGYISSGGSYYGTPAYNTSATYSPVAGVNVNLVLPPCGLMTLDECSAASVVSGVGIRQGLCMPLINPNNTIPSPVADSSWSVCASVNQSVCANVTTMYACITFTQLNYNTGQQVPVCEWRLAAGSVPAGCEALNPNYLASTVSEPNYPATVPNSGSVNVILPCAYRTGTTVATVTTASSWYCVFDGMCYSYLPSASSTISITPLCLPLNASAISYLETVNFVPTFSNITTPTAAASLLSAIGVSQSLCAPAQAQCASRYNIGTLRIQYLLTVASNITLTSPSLCNPLPATGGFCTSKYVFYAANWTQGWTDDTDSSHQANSLVSYCLNYASTCSQKCSLYGKDLDSCINAPLQTCFIDQVNLVCQQATTAERAIVCPGASTTSYAVGSACIQTGNLCTLLRVNQSLAGGGLSYSAANETLNSVSLLSSECAQIAGYAYGNFSNSANDTRLYGVILPALLYRLCTAVIDVSGPYCTQTALVGGCTTMSAGCDLISNSVSAFNNIINTQYCAYTTLGDCFLSTRDNVNFPCAWLYSLAGGTSNGGGNCVPLSQAQSTTAGNSAYGYYNYANYRQLTQIKSVRMQGSPNMFVSAGMDPSTFKYDPTVPLGPNDVAVIGPLQIQCPPGLYSKGFSCCNDAACTAGSMNPYHPKTIQIHMEQTLCSNASYAALDITTSIPYAGIQRTSLLDNTTMFYSVEGFVSAQGLFLFPLAAPSERQPEQVAVNGPTDLRTLTPLKKFTRTGAVGGDDRAMAMPYSFCYLNTCFQYDGIYNLESEMVSSQAGAISDLSVVTTQTVPNLSATRGVYYLSVSHYSALLSQIDNDINQKIQSNTLIFGSYPQAWNTYPDFGTYDAQGPMGADPQGNFVAKSNLLVFAFCSKAFTVPVRIVVAAQPTEYTASVTVNTNGTLTPVSIKVDNPAIGQLMNLGEQYVNYYDPADNTLYSAKDSFIGPDQPNKLMYVYSATPTDSFDFEKIVNPAANANWNPLYANTWIDQFSVTFSSPPVAGSPEQFCGTLLAGIQGATPAQLQLAAIQLYLNWPILSLTEQSLWNQRINQTSLGFIQFAVVEWQTVWSQLGCTGILSNFVDPGSITSFYNGLWAESVDPVAQTVSLPAVNSGMAPLVAAQNRAMCGNCVLIKGSDGNFTSTFPGVPNVCNPAFGTATQANIPRANTINALLAEQLAFCLKSSDYIITDDTVANTLSFEVRPGVATVSLAIVTQEADLVFQLEATTVCVVTTSTNATYSAGNYLMTFTNPFPFTVQYVISERLNISSFSSTPKAGNACELDLSLTLGANQNSTIYVPICSNEVVYIQVFDLARQACSIIYPASQSFTTEQLNATRSILDKQSSYLNGVLNVTEALATQLGALNSNLNAKIDLTAISLQSSIYNFNANLTNLGAVYETVFSQQQSLGNSFVNLDGRIGDVHVALSVVNDSLTSISNLVSQIAELQTIQANRTAGIQIALTNVVTEQVLGAIYAQANANLSAANALIYANITAENALLGTLITKGIGLIGKDAATSVDTTNSLLIAAVAIGCVATAASIVGIVLGSVVISRQNHDEIYKLGKEYAKRKADRLAQQQQQQQQEKGFDQNQTPQDLSQNSTTPNFQPRKSQVPSTSRGRAQPPSYRQSGPIAQQQQQQSDTKNLINQAENVLDGAAGQMAVNTLNRFFPGSRKAISSARDIADTFKRP